MERGLLKSSCQSRLCEKEEQGRGNDVLWWIYGLVQVSLDELLQYHPLPVALATQSVH